MTDIISIIGYGYVGSSIGYLCQKNNIEFNVYDIENKQGNFNYFDNISKLISFSEKKGDIHYIMIAVPTPSDTKGQCDISIIKSVLLQLQAVVTKETYIIIKSTLVPTTCRKLSEEFQDLNIILSPEFLREDSYKDDVYNAKFILLGIPLKFNLEKYQKILKLMRLFYKHNSQIDIFMKSYEECEVFKYTLNTFFITKITFFNEIFELCDKLGVDYQKLKNMFSLDPRIGEYGITIPGLDGKFGAGKKCLPKELAGMIVLREELGLDNSILKEVQKKNDLLREL